MPKQVIICRICKETKLILKTEKPPKCDCGGRMITKRKIR